MLRIDPSNEEATYMLANLMLMRDQTDGAIQTYIQLLDKEPDNFNMLANLI
jgi:cytochrome c-type biogenesis protein CcmH/NrfG